LVNVNFYSPALHRRAFYMVYLPPHYDPAKRYPVYYLLHGSPSRPQVFINLAGMDVRLDNLLLRGDVKPMILVFPDGRMGGSYMSDSEWANTPSGNFESYVVNVVHDVDQRFSTLPFRQYRDIAGFSEGAYGAINVALHHLDLFENVQVWSGYFTETRTGVFAHASSATLAYNSPLDYVHTLAASFTQFPTRIYMFVGRQDDSSSQMAPMDRALARVGADVSDRFFSGGHDWQLWWSQINPMIVRASRDMSHPLPAADARRVALVARATGGRRHHPAAHHRHFGASQHPARVHIAKPLALRAGALSVPAVRSAHAGESLRAGLLVGLVLAIVSAAMINLGFLLQHRGLVGGSDDGRRSLLRAFRSGAWLGGQALGWAGFALQILAVALAPLSLVQAFAAGGLAISVPLAAGLFHQRLSRNQIIAVAITAASLALLPLGLPRVAGRTHPGLLIVAALVAPAIAALLVAIRRPMMRAIAAGIFYGVADAGIKAEAIAVRAHGIGALASGWTLVAVLGTFVGFLAFQSALREGHPVSAISLMTALTALTALGFGVFAFGESLGRTPAVTIVHLLAIGLVLACVPVLGAAQAEESANRDRSPRLPDGGLGRRAAFLAGGGVAAALLLVLAIVVDVGLLYGLRELRWLAFGPHIPDALPLLQLAGFDRQPLGRVAIASLLAGLMFGLAISSVRPLTRTAAVGLLGTLLLLIASDASFALARNLPFSQVLDGRVPGFGPWLQGALFTVGVALPGLVAVRVPRSLPRLIAGQGIARGEPAGSL
jgi:enterochelin esterase-like enzyme